MALRDPTRTEEDHPRERAAGRTPPPPQLRSGRRGTSPPEVSEEAGGGDPGVAEPGRRTKGRTAARATHAKSVRRGRREDGPRGGQGDQSGTRLRPRRRIDKETKKVRSSSEVKGPLGFAQTGIHPFLDRHWKRDWTFPGRNPTYRRGCGRAGHDWVDDHREKPYPRTRRQLP